jgi:molecular chaperone DnaK (HSP70)
MNNNAYCFGIDLGTSSSSICFVNPMARHPLPYVVVDTVKVPRDEDEYDSSPRVPSLVYSKGKTIHAGFEALALWKRGWLWSTIFASAKSDLGTHRIYEDAEDSRLDNPVKVQAAILRYLIDEAGKRTGEDPRKSNIVVTVPASFEMSQRKQTLEAAEQAGLHLTDGDLIDEPNAAFLDLVNSQTIDRIVAEEPKNILVFDFGGGTTDVTILKVRKDAERHPLGLLIENLAISNYERLGGDNIDLYLVDEFLIPEICSKSGIEFAELTERDKRDLRWNAKEEARRLKERLCNKARSVRDESDYLRIKQNWTVDGFHLNDWNFTTKRTQGEMTFPEFELTVDAFLSTKTDGRLEMADGYLVGSVFAPVFNALEKAQLKPEDIDVVLLNGGSSRNPLVSHAFRESSSFAGTEIIESPDLDLAVARGATMHCYYKHHHSFEPITPIVTSEIGLVTHGEHFESLVPAGTRLPFPADGKFKRYSDCFWLPKDGMTQVHFPVYSGGGNNRQLAQTIHMSLPPQTKRGEPVIVELHIDSNKVMNFRAYLATYPSAPLELKLENPLAMRLPNPPERCALEERKRVFEKRRLNNLYRPSVDELINLANLERLAGGTLQGMEILQRLEHRSKKLDQPLPARAHNLMALCYEQVGRRDKALNHYKQATEIEPSREVFASNYGCTLAQQGRAEDAIPHLRRAIGLNKTYGVPYVMLGDALRQLGREEEALAEYRQGKTILEETLRARPKDEHAMSWLEGACRNLGQYEEANRYRSRLWQIAHADHFGASPDELVAGLDSGIVRSGELKDGETGK